MRTLSAALLAAQQGTKATPHIHISINSVDYSARLLFLEHHEEAYRERATLIFRNDDLAFNAVDLTGKKFKVGYGHYTGINVAEPDGDGAGNEYSYTADLWVKSQQMISSQGELICQLYCEGHWVYLREQRLMAYGSAPNFDFTFDATDTIYELIEHIIEGAFSWTLSALATSDGIIDLSTFKPIFSINEMPYENAAALLYRLISMTKSYIRVRANSVFDIIYPQTGDAVNETYYDNQGHRFLEYNEKVNLTIPNSIAVYANEIADGDWSAIITGTASDAAQIAKYTTVLEPFLAGSITTLANANLRAAAILTKILAEQLAGKLIIPHDAGMELYDKPSVVDSRSGYTYPSAAITRVTNLIHRYDRRQGVYLLEAALGEVTSDFGMPTPERYTEGQTVLSAEKYIPGVEYEPPPAAPVIIQLPPFEAYEPAPAPRVLEMRAAPPIIPSRPPSPYTPGITPVPPLFGELARERPPYRPPSAYIPGETPIPPLFGEKARPAPIIRESPEAQKRLADLQEQRKKWWEFWK